MLVATLACLLALAVVLLSLLRDEPLAPPQAAPPDWDPLPAPMDLSRVRFPMSFPGYDPAAVEAALDVLNRAYAQLLEEAPADTLARIRRRLAPPDPDGFGAPPPPVTAAVLDRDDEEPAGEPQEGTTDG